MMRARWLARRHSRLRRRARPDRCSACRTDLADLRVTRSSTPLAVGSFRLIHGVGTPQLQFGEPRHVLEVSIGAEQTEVSAQAQPGDQRINRAHLDSPRAARCVLLGGLPVVGSTRNQQRQLFKLGNDPVLDSTFAQTLDVEVWLIVATLAVGAIRSLWLGFLRERPHRHKISDLGVVIRGKSSSSHELINAPEASEALTCDDRTLSRFDIEPGATKKVGQRCGVHIDQCLVVVATRPFACRSGSGIWPRRRPWPKN